MRTTATGTPAHALEAGSIVAGFPLTTDEFAQRHRVKRNSVYARLCRTGSYFGVRPLKLATGRTFWPDVAITADPAPSLPTNQAQEGRSHA